MSNPKNPIRAMLFDLDGTLIDSMPHHHAAGIEWHRLHERPMHEEGFFAATAGRTNAEIFADMLPERSAAEHHAMAEQKEALYRDIAQTRLELLPGAQAFARQARERGLKLAICTAAGPKNLAFAIERYGLDGWVDTITSPADGLRGKPHPDIFAEASRRLGVPAAECLVFEDAPLGVEAARRAGMRAVALTTTESAAAFEAFDNLLAIVPDLSHLRLDDLTGG